MNVMSECSVNGLTRGGRTTLDNEGTRRKERGDDKGGGDGGYMTPETD